MAGNRFEKWRAPISTALRQMGFSHQFAEINNTVISYVRGPNNGTPLVLLPAQMGTWRTYEKSRTGAQRQLRGFRGGCARAWQF